MFENIDGVISVLWAAVIGIIFAVIYTNIFRSSLYKFIRSLTKNDDGKPKLLTELGIYGISAFMVKRAVQNQHGLERAIEAIPVNNKDITDEAELLLNGSGKKFKYILKEDANKDELLKKYKYESVGFGKIILLILLIIVTAFAATKAVDLFDSYLESKREEAKQQEEDDASKQDDTDDDSSIVDENTNSPTVPTIPTTPTVPTAPQIPTAPSSNN